MAFKWNGIHATEIGLMADITGLPFRPLPKIATEQLPAMDGFLDFSMFNNNNRVHYNPREWVFQCWLELKRNMNINIVMNEIAKIFMVHSGYLEVDECPGVRWQAIVANRFDIANVAINAKSFNIYFQSQPFAEGLTPITQTTPITTNPTTINLTNPGTWHTRPNAYLTGTANNARIGGLPIPNQGELTNALVWCPELAPGANSLSISGFTGSIRFEFTPLYIWSLP